VSVVIPLYNHAAFIEAALDSVLAQGSIVKEIIVVDDGSRDASAAVMEGLLRRDRRIGFSRQENRGAHNTINGALRRCTGELLAILNSDDTFLPGRLTTLAAALDADPGADIAASALSFMDGAGKAIANSWYDEALAFHQAGTPLAAALVNGNFLMTTSNFLVRRSAFDVIGEFAGFRYVHDLEWLLRALALGHRIVISDKPLLRYRIHGGNTIAEEHGKVRAEWAMAAAAYLTLRWDRPEAPPIDWNEAETITEVLRRHGLDRAVTPCMAYLRRHGVGLAGLSSLLQDEVFKEYMRGWI
jgi:glycosyltransferase involved in cell wall biosynthesis